jgi:hypothetical protein
MLEHSRCHTTVRIVPPCTIFYVTKHCMRLSTSSLAKTENYAQSVCGGPKKLENLQHQVKLVANLPISKHTAVVARNAILHHWHSSNLEHVLLKSTK